MRTPIIDAHCHAGPGDGFTGPWDTEAPLEAYLRRCDEAGIARTNLLAAFHIDYAVANEEVGRIIAGRPGRFTGFAFVHAERDRGRVLPMVRRAVRDLGFRGIKVHRLDARISREICEVARRLRLPVLYDVAGETTAVRLFAGQYPDVDFVIPHLGSFADDWTAQRAFCPVLADLSNVHTDTSGVRRFDLLVRAVREAGAHKVLFGSDGPWLHPGLELEKVRLLRLSPADEARVLGGNFLRLTRVARRRYGPATRAAVSRTAATMSSSAAPSAIRPRT
ncbi:amidohydrolase family protein [Paractinoplanes globisporus]|uniref:Amidohydrolase family protein n=1 Tax=Paractinoplanes globisporus TaxID=113565 RepID=A0ABW6WLM6_9ACTN|nr:amidohydrolase family protein [Actinoplanes globisporus]